MSKKSIDLTFANLANAHSALVKRNEKAKAYSEECKQKRKRKNNLYDWLVILVLILVNVGIFMICDAGHKANAKTEETEKTIITEESVLVDIDEEGNYILQTPDGNQWKVQDPPEVYYELTFDTNGTDDRTDDVVIGLDELK